MKFKCCDYLLHQIVFDQYEIKPCCGVSMNGKFLKLVDNFDGNTSSIEEYLTERKKYINIFKSGNIPICCTGCPLLKEKEWDETNLKFNRIIVANTAKCSCNCIYCVYTHDDPNAKSFYNHRKTYNIISLLQTLQKNNLIEKNLFLVIGGGECTEFPLGELEGLIYFTSFFDGKIQILSSGINYSKTIAQALQSLNVELCISPDAGTKQTYEKIKRINAFERTWDNLKNYISDVKNNADSKVEIKYIIIPGINDNLKEAEAFLKKCKSIEATHIKADIEHYWYSENKDKPVPEHIFNLIKFFEKDEEINVTYSVETEFWLKGSNEEL